jgi:hypothetical protein
VSSLRVVGVSDDGDKAGGADDGGAGEAGGVTASISESAPVPVGALGSASSAEFFLPV